MAHTSLHPSGCPSEDFGHINSQLELIAAPASRLLGSHAPALGLAGVGLALAAWLSDGTVRLVAVGSLGAIGLVGIAQLALAIATARRLTKATLALSQLAASLSEADDVASAAGAGLAAARTLLRPKVKVGIGVTIDAATVSLGQPLGGVQTIVGDETVRLTIAGPIARYESWCCHQIAMVVSLALTAVQDRSDRVSAALEADWKALARAGSEVGFILDAEGMILKATPNAEDVFGSNLTRSRLLDHLPVGARPFTDELFQDPNDVLRWVRIRYQEASNDSYIATISDVTEELRAQRIDVDTGLANLADFAQQDSINHATILMIRADGYQQIKQAAGVAASQNLLSVLAVRLQAHFRAGIDQIWRASGPTFLVVSPGADNDVSWVENKRLKLSAPALVGDSTVAMPITVAMVPVHSEVSAGDALRMAEVTLEYARQSAPERVVVFSEELQIRAEREYQLSSDLAAAANRLASAGLSVHYQPVVDAFDGRVVAVEALARWRHPKLGDVGPDEFINIAERAGLVEQIDRFVLETTIGDVAELRAAEPELGIHVNLSPVGLTPGRVREVSNTIVAALGRSSNMTVELIESAIGEDNLTGILGALGDMRSAGIGVALDDFGVGESNFSRLARLPLTQVKLANVFTTDVSPELAVGVIATIHNMGLECVVEGVETVPQADQMQAAGADSIQGWLFAKASPVQEAAAFIRERNSGSRSRTGSDSNLYRL